MDDLISRNAIEHLVMTKSYDLGEPIQKRLMMHDVESLPSAQPRIMTCSKCKHKIKCFSQIAVTNKYQTTTIFYDIDFCSRWENEDNE